MPPLQPACPTGVQGLAPGRFKGVMRIQGEVRGEIEIPALRASIVPLHSPTAGVAIAERAEDRSTNKGTIHKTEPKSKKEVSQPL